MSKNILITGANGQVGQELQVLIEKKEHALKDASFYFTDSDTLDITDKDALQTFITHNTIDTIINCAAYTAVDNAENDALLANSVNHLAVKYLAGIAKSYDIQLLHISTDYIFDGTNHRPYVEDDLTNPESIYGKTKLDGELAMCAINPPNSTIIRTSWVYSSFGKNFVKTMLSLGTQRDELGIIFDQVGTPTYARDLAKMIFHIIQNDRKNKDGVVEIYHYSNEGVTSWYDFAKAIFEIANIECKVNPILTEAYPTAAKRPLYSVLNKEKIKREQKVEVPYWKDSLAHCLDLLLGNDTQKN